MYTVCAEVMFYTSQVYFTASFIIGRGTFQNFNKEKIY